MRRARRHVAGLSAGFLAVVLATLTAAGDRASESKDPLAAEIERWSTYLKANTSTDEDWLQLKQMAEPAIESARGGLGDGRRLMALQRLSSVRPYLSASSALGERPAGELKDSAAFEAEWTRVGRVLHGDLGSLSPTALDGVRPAAVRAIGEAALPQVKDYYEASLEYGRNTVAKSGFFYIAIAQAQRDFVSLCRALSAPTTRDAPPLRSLAPELDALEAELLAAYRPPAAIDRHGEFIVSSSTLKEARELDAAGLRYGAMLRYLQAALRSAPLRPAGKPLDARALGKRLQELDARLSAGNRDDSIGRIFLEFAQADVAAAAAGKGADIAMPIAGDVLPRYFAALQPARPRAPKPASAVTVTLVRWPYT